MTTLVLKHANNSRLGNIDWSPDDYDVFKDERCIGRIFQSPAAPSARNWMWTIIAREHPPTIFNHAGTPRRASKRWRISRGNGKASC